MDYEEDFSSVVSHTVSVTHFTRHNRKEFRTKNSATSGRPCNALCQSKSCKKVHLSLRAGGGHLAPLQIHGSLDPYFFIPNSMSIVLSHFSTVHCCDRQTDRHTHTDTHARTRTHTFNGPFSGLPRSAGTRKAKPIWILLKQETVSGSGISWAICKSAPCSRQIPCQHPTTQFLQAGCPSCRPTNSVKALKAVFLTNRQTDRKTDMDTHRHTKTMEHLCAHNVA